MISEPDQEIYNGFYTAYQEALRAKKLNEVPVGACLTLNGKVISSAHNQIRQKKDPTAHAELEAIRLASQKLDNERLPGTQLFTTLEPCGLCSGAIILARIKKVHFLAFEERMPALRDILSLPGHNHIPAWEKCELDIFPAAELLRGFFHSKRIKKDEHKA